MADRTALSFSFMYVIHAMQNATRLGCQWMDFAILYACFNMHKP
jgi:hypothetical protein